MSNWMSDEELDTEIEVAEALLPKRDVDGIKGSDWLAILEELKLAREVILQARYRSYPPSIQLTKLQKSVEAYDAARAKGETTP